MRSHCLAGGVVERAVGDLVVLTDQSRRRDEVLLSADQPGRCGGAVGGHALEATSLHELGNGQRHGRTLGELGRLRLQVEVDDRRRLDPLDEA